MAGRRPKPTAIKELTGNPGKRPLNDEEPEPELALPECPKHLGKHARKEWKRVAAELHSLGLLTRIDRAALAGYCQAWERWVAASEQLQKFGAVIKTPTGYPIQNPYLAIANTALDQVRKFAVEFGMTPSSRSRVKTGKKKNPEADEWADLAAELRGDETRPN